MTRAVGRYGVYLADLDPTRGGEIAKTRPVVVHCLTSAIQMSAWRRYTRGERLP